MKTPFLSSYSSYFSVLFSRLTLVGGVALLVSLLFFNDLKLRVDLRDVLSRASADVSDLFVAYNAEEGYTAEEILMLTQGELQATLLSWPRRSKKIFLQIINIQARCYYDSRTQEIAEYQQLDDLSFVTRYGTPRKGNPVLYVDRDLTGNDSWFLRAGIRPTAYFIDHLMTIVVVIPVCAALIVGYHAFSEVRRRRRFDRLVSSMLTIMRHADEATLISAAPKILTGMLDFDSVALYLREGERIVPKSVYFSKDWGDPEAFLRSTEAEPITVDSDYPEARAVRENKGILVTDPRTNATVHQTKLKAAGLNPYLIAIMRSDEKDSAIGLLTAQYHRGLRPEHEEYLRSAAQLLALLIEKFRAKDALEKVYRQMVRNTRTVTIGTVVPFIAHNMRTPLTIIAQLAKSVRDSPGGFDRKEEDRAVLDRIKSQADFCFDLLHSISQYGKLGDSSKGTVRVKAAIDKVCEFFREYFRIKGIHLEKSYVGELDPRFAVELEELDFVQVITNLLINSDEAFTEMLERSDPVHDDPRQFRIEVRVESRQEDSRLIISIKDNGPGIHPENLEKVFEDGFTTKVYGTGVGLPYCRRVIEQAGGELTVESHLGNGTSFSIALAAKDSLIPAPSRFTENHLPQ